MDHKSPSAEIILHIHKHFQVACKFQINRGYMNILENIEFNRPLKGSIAHFRVLTFLETGPEFGRESEASCEVRLAGAKIKRDR